MKLILTLTSNISENKTLVTLWWAWLSYVCTRAWLSYVCTRLTSPWEFWSTFLVHRLWHRCMGIICFHSSKGEKWNKTKRRVNRFYQGFFHGQERPEIRREKYVWLFLPKWKTADLWWENGVLEIISRIVLLLVLIVLHFTECSVCRCKTVGDGKTVWVNDWVKGFEKMKPGLSTLKVKIVSSIGMHHWITILKARLVL